MGTKPQPKAICVRQFLENGRWKAVACGTVHQYVALARTHSRVLNRGLQGHPVMQWRVVARAA